MLNLHLLYILHQQIEASTSNFFISLNDEKCLSSFYLFLFLPLCLAVSDMRREHGVWSGRTVCCQTVPRACCRPPWGPVSAAVPRVWRRGHGEPLTVAFLSPTGRPCSTETPSTRSATLRIATGVREPPLPCSCGTYGQLLPNYVLLSLLLSET